MEKYIMFMDQKNKYSENEYTTQSNLQVPMVFFTELDQIISQFVWKHRKPYSQSNLEAEEWNWRNQPA